MTDITLINLERRVKPGRHAGLYLEVPATPDQHGLYAEVQYRTRFGVNTLELSRLEGEDRWVVDAQWGPGNFPVFANGYGARYCGLKIPPADIADLLDHATTDVTYCPPATRGGR